MATPTETTATTVSVGLVSSGSATTPKPILRAAKRQPAELAAAMPATKQALPEWRTVMAKVYSLHMIALKAGASGPDFERFFREEIKRVPGPSGLTMRLLKGDRGDREGKYLVMFEFESVERRDQLFPETGPAARQMSGEVMQWMGSAGPSLARWNEFTTPFDAIYTDYQEIAS